MAMKLSLGNTLFVMYVNYSHVPTTSTCIEIDLNTLTDNFLLSRIKQTSS